MQLKIKYLAVGSTFKCFFISPNSIFRRFYSVSKDDGPLDDKLAARHINDVHNMTKFSELGDENILHLNKPLNLKAKSNTIPKSPSSYDNSLKYMSSYSESGDPSVTRYTAKGIGVFREKEADDIAVLINNYSSPALARAIREREDILQTCALLCSENNFEKIKVILRPFEIENVQKRRNKKRTLDVSGPFERKDLVILQRYLHRMPRQLYQSARDRASVFIPLCNQNGKASILFQKRSAKVRKHKHDVCFPGGMVDEQIDSTIIQTSLREMSEELAIDEDSVDVLGILRCNWTEVASMTGISVTPVVGFIGELNDLKIIPNSDEVSLNLAKHHIGY